VTVLLLHGAEGAGRFREVVRHADSVAVVALDENQHVRLIQQYRHPVGRKLGELPAGLRDLEGESPLEQPAGVGGGDRHPRVHLVDVG
jgi:hypothetical protein